MEKDDFLLTDLVLIAKKKAETHIESNHGADVPVKQCRCLDAWKVK